MSARESWGHEMESVFLYRVVAEAEPSDERRALFTKLAGEAEAQAAIWAEEIRKAGGPPPDAYVPPARARIVAALVRRFGPRRMKSVLAAMKVRGMSIYSVGFDGAELGASGRSRDAAFGGRDRAAAPRRHRGRQPARGRVRRERRPGVERLPDPGCGGRVAAARATRCWCRASPGCSRARSRWRRANTCRCARSARCSSTRSAPSATSWRSIPHEEAAELSLIYQARGPGQGRRRPHVVAHRRQPGLRAGRAGARGAGPGSGRAGIAGRRGGVLVRGVRGRRGGAAGAVRCRGAAARRWARRSR